MTRCIYSVIDYLLGKQPASISWLTNALEIKTVRGEIRTLWKEVGEAAGNTEDKSVGRGRCLKSRRIVRCHVRQVQQHFDPRPTDRREVYGSGSKIPGGGQGVSGGGSSAEERSV